MGFEVEASHHEGPLVAMKSTLYDEVLRACDKIQIFEFNENYTFVNDGLYATLYNQNLELPDQVCTVISLDQDGNNAFFGSRRSKACNCQKQLITSWVA